MRDTANVAPHAQKGRIRLSHVQHEPQSPREQSPQRRVAPVHIVEQRERTHTHEPIGRSAVQRESKLSASRFGHIVHELEHGPGGHSHHYEQLDEPQSLQHVVEPIQQPQQRLEPNQQLLNVGRFVLLGATTTRQLLANA